MDEHSRRQRRREANEFWGSMTSMKEQELITQPRQQKHIIHEQLIKAIKDEHNGRQQRTNELKHMYYQRYPELGFIEDHDESFYEWLRNKDVPADDNKIREFLDSI